MVRLNEKYNLEYEDFGSYIRELRERRRLTLVQIAEKLKISTNYVSQLERNIRRPTDELIIGFSKLYNIDEDVLFQKSGQVPLRSRKVVSRNKNLQKSLSFIYKSSLSKEKESEIMNEFVRIIAGSLNVNDDDILNEWFSNEDITMIDIFNKGGDNK